MSTSPRMRWPYPAEGTDPWYDAFEDMVRAQDATALSLQDQKNIILSGGGNIAWDAATGVVSWSAPILLNSSQSGFIETIPVGSLYVPDDGQYGFVRFVPSPQDNVELVLRAADVLPATDVDRSFVLFRRRQNKLYWRNGGVLSSGESAAIIDDGPGGGGGAGALEVRINGTTVGTSGVLNFQSPIVFDGSVSAGVTSVNLQLASSARAVTTTPYTFEPAYRTFYVNVGTAASFNLPPASSLPNQLVIVKTLTSNSVIIYPNGSDTIDGYDGLELENQHESVTLQSASPDGGATWDWFMIAKLCGGGGGGGGIGGSIAEYQIAYGTGPNTIGGSANLEWNFGTDTLSIGDGTSTLTIQSSTIDSNAPTLQLGGGAVISIGGNFTLPTNAGSPGQVLTTDGLGGTSWEASSGGVTSVGATTPLESSGGTAPTISLTGIVDVGNGGTGLDTLTGGSLLVGNGTGAVSLLAPGSPNQVLTVVGGAWVASDPAVTSPASPLNSVQFNNGGSFGGSANLTYVSGTSTLGSAAALNIEASADSTWNVTGANLIISTTGGGPGRDITLQSGNEIFLNPGGAGDSVVVNGGYNPTNFQVRDQNFGSQPAFFVAGSTGFSGFKTATPNERVTINGVLSLAEVPAPSLTEDFGKLYALNADSRPYWLDSSGQAYNLTLDRFNTLTYGVTPGSVTIDTSPALPVFNSLALNQNTTFTTSNLGNGRSASVRVVCDGTTRTLAFPGDWTWLGSGPPADLAAGVVGYLSLTAYGATDSDVVAAWSYENMLPVVMGSGVDNQLAVWSGTYTQDGSPDLTWDGTTLGIDGSVSVNDKFNVDPAGNVTKINNVPTSFPPSQGAANTLLRNDGAGNLSWVANIDYRLVDLDTSASLLGHAVVMDVDTVVKNGNAGAFATSLVVGFVKVVGPLGVGKVQTIGIVEGVQFVPGLTLAAGNRAFLSLVDGHLTNTIAGMTTPNVMAEVGIVSDASQYAVDGTASIIFGTKVPVAL